MSAAVCLAWASCIRIGSDSCLISSFFFNDTATTEIYTLSLHDALPISRSGKKAPSGRGGRVVGVGFRDLSGESGWNIRPRSEEHTSELQSHHDLVCRLLLEKKKQKYND